MATPADGPAQPAIQIVSSDDDERDDDVGDDGSALATGWVRKPLFSREGANIEMHLADGSTQRSDGPYDGPAIIQRAHPLTRFEGGYPLIGSWVVGDHACGIGIREDDSAITRDSARFVPHAIVDEAPTRIYV